MTDAEDSGIGGGAPTLTATLVRQYAATSAVCGRPLVRQVTDRVSGEVHQLVIPCGSTREAVCPTCAEKARRLRMQQCAEGWHCEDDPLDDRTDDGHADRSCVEGGDEEGSGGSPQNPSARRVRSTRRRDDVERLPRVAAEERSVGRTFTAPDGTTYRPSMFVTLTLGSYGKVISARPDASVPGAGSPLAPGRYDYRRAAVEAMFFSRLFDRWMQNLRRCAGFKVQYFGAIEPQRRLAPHIHLAIRGAIPRATLRAVTRATYLQLWWPSFDEPVYTDELPRWDAGRGVYVDPGTGVVLPSWKEALNQLGDDLDASPAVVMQFGAQVDIKGIIAPSEDADRSVRYLAKYLTKSVTDTYADPDHGDQAYEAHIDRLHRELVFLPCSPECSNWLRYGIQPKDASPGLIPGCCPSASHDRENLGVGGRRVQVSRHWSGKTLREHRADRAAVVREVLAEAGVVAPETDRMAASVLAADGEPRFVWEPVRVGSADYPHLVLNAVVETLRWREEYEGAKARIDSRASPAGSVHTSSATSSAA